MPGCQASLSVRGYGINKSSLSQHELDELKKELTVSPVNHMLQPNQVPSFPLFLESSKKVYVPKYFGLMRYGAAALDDRLPEGSNIDVTFTGKMRPEQMRPVDAFLTAANDPTKRGGILSLPCGSGKTVIALHILARLKKKTMIIVHKDFLLQQWRERIQQFMPGARVGLIKAKHLDVVDKDVVIASVQSLSMKAYPESTFSDIGLVVIDEVHRTGTEVFSKALQKVNFKYSLGLSATVNRKDGLTKVFVWFIGDVVYKVARRTDRMDVVMREFFAKDPAYCSEYFSFGNKLNTSRMLNSVCDYEQRTRMIVDIIQDVYHRSDCSRRFLILSDRKSQLTRIHDMLKAPCEGNHQMTITSGFYIGGMKPAALEESLTKHVILATFSFASEGFDAQHLDTLVLASPKTDIEQSVGRILRVQGPSRRNVPLVIDIVDAFSVFERQADKRRRFYKKHGYTVAFQDSDQVGRSVMDALRQEEEEGSGTSTNNSDTEADDECPSSGQNKQQAEEQKSRRQTSKSKKSNGGLVSLPPCAFLD
jgi:superfamily II DNA or RNA helicase